LTGVATCSGIQVPPDAEVISLDCKCIYIKTCSSLHVYPPQKITIQCHVYLHMYVYNNIYIILS